MQVRRGWYGNSQGHSLAAKGIKLYAKKYDAMMQPIFYAQKREEQVPTLELMTDIKEGLSFEELKLKYPDANAEDLRKRAIRQIDNLRASNTMNFIESNGVDDIMKAAEKREDVLELLSNGQYRSYIQAPKAKALQTAMR